MHWTAFSKIISKRTRVDVELPQLPTEISELERYLRQFRDWT